MIPILDAVKAYAKTLISVTKLAVEYKLTIVLITLVATLLKKLL